MAADFDPDAYLAEKDEEAFDPDAYLAGSAPKAPATAGTPVDSVEPGLFSPKSKSGTALRGFAQGGSYGFSDELAGLVGAGVRRIADMGVGAAKSGVGRKMLRMYLGTKADGLPDAALDALVDRATDEGAYPVLGVQPRETGGKGLPGATYEQQRDVARQELKQSQAANPGTYMAANIAGGIAAPGPKGGPIRVGGATLKPWVGRALAGAAIGGASGAGMSEGETAGDVAGDVALNAGIGGVAAPLMGAATDKAGGAFAKWLEQRSRLNALKAIGLTPGISDKARQLGYTNADELATLGAKIRDEGDIIKAFGRPESTVPRLESALEESTAAKSAAIDEIERMAQEQGRKFDFNRLAQRADDALRPAEGWDPLTRERAKGAMEMLGKASAAQGGFPMAEQVRRAAGKSIPWKAPAFGHALPEDVAMMRRGYGTIADEILEQARDVEARNIIGQGGTPKPGDLGASDQIAAMNKRISSLMDAQQLASANATREAAKSGPGLKDLLTAGAVGSPAVAAFGPLVGGAVGVGAATASKLAEGRLPSALTYAQHGAAQSLPGLMSSVEQPLIRSVAGADARSATENAYDNLMRRFGIRPKDQEQTADLALTSGLMDSP